MPRGKPKNIIKRRGNRYIIKRNSFSGRFSRGSWIKKQKRTRKEKPIEYEDNTNREPMFDL
jgi:hypothetical protein